MRITRLASFALASSLLLAGSASTALAQDPAPPQDKATPAPQEKAKDPAAAQSISGELVKVDTEKKVLSVKMSDGAEWAFDYTSQTEITGANKGEQGLATAEGSKVVVTYTTADDKKIATKVEVQPPPPAK
jgi:glucose/arabinose dehydrogenase